MSQESQDRDALKKAIQASRDLTASERAAYARLVKKVGGKGTKHRIVNKLRQSCGTLQMELSSGRPRCRIVCDAPDERRSFAKRQEVNLNRLAQENHVEDTFSQCVLAGFFKMGIAYLYTADAAPLLFGTDNYVIPGKPGIGNVSFEDYFQDMTAQRSSGFQFQGHYFDIPFDELNNGVYDKSVVKKIRLDDKTEYSFEGSDTATSRDAFGFRPNKERLIRPRLRCVHIYRPDLRKAFVYPYRMETPPLWVGDVNDPDGTYGTITFDEIPDNTLPAGQAEVLEPLDDLINSTWRKMALMINQMRDIFVTEQGHEDDAKKQRDAKHGEYVVVKSLDGTEVRSIGGVNKNAAGTSAMLAAEYNGSDNNLQLRAGIGPSAPTATQDAQLGNANSGIAARQKYRVLRFYARCFDGLRRRMWDDKVTHREAYFEHPRLPGVKVPAHWDPQQRIGTVDDYECDILPETISYRSGEQEAAAMIQTVNELAPILPPDRMPDIDRIVSDLADLRGLPKLRGWFQVVEPSEDAAREAAQAPRNKVSTQIRRSESAAGAINPLQAAVATME